jgi:hypothetical protein
VNQHSLGDHLGEIGQEIVVTGTVRTATRVNGFTPRSPDRVLIVVDAGAAMVKIVTAAAWAHDVERGEQVTLAGTVRAHSEWRGIRQTVLTRAARIDPAPADPDAPSAAALWEEVNPAEARPRPFPRTPDSLAATTQAPAHRPRL